MQYVILVFLALLLLWRWSKKQGTDCGQRSLKRQQRLVECRAELSLEKTGIDVDADPVKAVVDLSNALRRAERPEEAREFLRQNLLSEDELQLAMRFQKEAYQEEGRAAAERKRPRSGPSRETELPVVVVPEEKIVPPPVESGPPQKESLRTKVEPEAVPPQEESLRIRVEPEAVPPQEEGGPTPTGEPQTQEQATESPQPASGNRWQGKERSWRESGRQRVSDSQD